uniref:Kallikrein-related peptidase 8 transcript variant 15 n=1 Tax=Homo sapiens TaxID=9606 RepID=A0A2I2MQ02_HUMAN|nr:kallikrein-related peptidase 8 transcript variant 15 [Homo sapiens]
MGRPRPRAAKTWMFLLLLGGAWAEVKIFPQKKCEDAYPGQITDGMVCAGSSKGADTCQGTNHAKELVKRWDSRKRDVVDISDARLFSFSLSRAILEAPWCVMVHSRASHPGAQTPVGGPTNLASIPTSAATWTGSRRS